jgi:hypothetical protein
MDATLQRASLDLVRALNERTLALSGDPEIATRIASYEMAFRLQTSAPELMNLKSESTETLVPRSRGVECPARACGGVVS